MIDRFFNYREFFVEVKKVLVRPEEFFSTMPLQGGLVEPVIKAMIYSAVASMVSVFLPSAVVGATNGIITSTGGILDILQFLIYSFIGIFACGAMLLTLSSICNGNQNFEANLRVAASMFVLSPVITLIAFIFLKSQLFGTIVLLALVFYSFRILYIALVKALNAKQIWAKRLVIGLAVLPALVIITSFIREKISSGSMNTFYMNSPSRVEEEFMSKDPSEVQGENKAPAEQKDDAGGDAMKGDPGNFIPDDESDR